MRLEIHKGELEIIWRAAHFKNRKITKKDLNKTSIERGVEVLLNEQNEIPLRQSSQCLVGLARIHYRKSEYLYTDSNEAFNKMRLQISSKKNKVTLQDDVARGKNDTTLLEAKDEENEFDEFGLSLDMTNFNIDINGPGLIGMRGDDTNSIYGSDLNIDIIDEHQANEHDITMQESQDIALSLEKPRKHSFGSAGLIHDNISLNIEDLDVNTMDDVNIDISFGDEDQILLNEGHSQERLLDNDELSAGVPSIEIARGADALSSIHGDMPDHLSIGAGSIGLQSHKGSVGLDVGSHMDPLSPNKSVHSVNLPLEVSHDPIGLEFDVHSASDVQSIHASIAGSVDTHDLQQIREEEETPPRKRRKLNEEAKDANEGETDNDFLPAIKSRNKRRRKKRFPMDDDSTDLSDAQLKMDATQLHPNRNLMHIWKETSLANQKFDVLFTNPSVGGNRRIPNVLSKLFKKCVKLHESRHPRRDPMAVDEEDMLGRDEEEEKAGEEEAGGNLMDDLPFVQPMDYMDETGIPSASDHEMDEVVNDAATHRDLDVDITMGLDINLEDTNEEILPPNEIDENVLNDESTDESYFEKHLDSQTRDMIKAREWTVRTKKAYKVFDRKCQDSIYFHELVPYDQSKAVAAAMFYEMLLFKNHGLVQVEQTEPFGPIHITKTKAFEEHKRRSQRMSQRLSQLSPEA